MYAVWLVRTVFITGASSGIGRALALEYASRGAHVAVAARRQEALDEVVHGATGNGGRALALAVDVCDPPAIADAVRKAERDLGSLDLVIANAGVGSWTHAGVLRFDEVSALLDVNVKGAMATLLAAVPIMLHQKRGHLVGITSLAGRRGLPMSGAYSASKACLSIFLETLRVDLRASGIRVTDVQPGYVETPLTEKNKYPMPFLWKVDKAARVIADRLESAPAVVAFPWQLSWALHASRLVPNWLYDRVISSMR